MNRSVRHFSMDYAKRDNRRAFQSLFGTLVCYLLCLTSAIVLIPEGLLAAPFLVGAALMVMRFYILQHDCGHFAFFETRHANHLAGRFCAVFTLASFDAMRFNHNLHHANTSDLDERDSHEVLTLTVREYHDLPTWAKLGYRAYRHPLIMFVIGPTLIFFIRYRLPNNWSRTGLGDVIRNNILIALFWGGVFALTGWAGICALAISTALAASMGVAIVYLQHNFETTYWERNPDLDIETAALQGSSVLDFGAMFDLISANIAYHDLHHLNAKIPCYQLKDCHQSLRNQLDPNRIGWAEALRSFKWKLWNEETERMTVFPPLKNATIDQAEATLTS